MNKLVDTFKQTADRIAFLDRGYGINKPDVQSAIESLSQRINEMDPSESVAILEAILSALREGKLNTAIFDSQGNPISPNNRLPVDVGGQIHADVDLGDVTVDIGVVKQGGKDVSAEPWEVQLAGQLQMMDRIVSIGHTLGPGETYKTARPLNASRIQSDIATIFVAGRANAKRDIDVYVSMKPDQSHETEKILVYSSLEDAVPQATHVFNIFLQYPEFYLHVTNRSSSTFTVQTITLVGRGVR